MSVINVPFLITLMIAKHILDQLPKAAKENAFTEKHKKYFRL